MLDGNTREENIVKTSIVGIIVNVILTLFKIAVGVVSGSIAIILDGVNNLSDALSSVITIIGMYLSSKPPNRKHPYGYGRIEYFTALIIAAIIISAGVESFIESTHKIMHPTDVNYSFIVFVIMIVAIIVKLLLGRYTIKKGEENNSDSLINSGKDASLDAIVTIATLISAIIFTIFHINLDGILGAIIGLVIIKAGIEMILDSLGEILGKRVDKELSENIHKDVEKFDNVKGAYDLILNNYGPENYIGSINIGVDESLSGREIYKLSREIQGEILKKYGIILTIGIYATNSKDPEIEKIISSLNEICLNKKNIHQIHGVYVDKESKIIQFDIVVDFDIEDTKQYKENLTKELQNEFKDYNISILIDRSISDII
ncbi:cation diffusion facilitator family transporter [uncultured Methanobrevibacter sp.]|uniref:cation diffusion facilitator family transporter n=1 Tax=uncultured Methanobrevibacter sp. TaxID=253161 RepID=UPI0025F1542A|nr:cation diffusion facilitator family transporter [uncultured Methanobrevibacter sp.]